jgi:hypothetical protein
MDLVVICLNESLLKGDNLMVAVSLVAAQFLFKQIYFVVFFLELAF